VPGIEGAAGDAARRHHPGLAINLLEQRRMLEEARRQLVGGQPWRPVTRGQGKDGERLVDLVEVHVPAGETVLCRREAGHESRDGARRGRRKDRSHARLQVTGQMRTGRGVPDQRAQTEAIDHQEDDVAGAAER
jgi:hypothetical protein